VPSQKWYGLIAAVDARTNKIAWQKRVPAPMCGGSGILATASGLVFTASPDGNMWALDSRSGELLWEFQIGQNGPTGAIGPAAGPMMSYEANGRQFIATLMAQDLWAFSLEGKLTPRANAGPPPLEQPFAGAIEAVSNIQLATVITQNNPDSGVNEPWHDEYGIRPSRARIKAGTTVTWTNTGQMTHTLAARTNEWSTPPIRPGDSATLTFEKPGTYTYICREHPWSIAQLVVE
jgi:plastocyanin